MKHLKLIVIWVVLIWVAFVIAHFIWNKQTAQPFQADELAQYHLEQLQWQQQMKLGKEIMATAMKEYERWYNIYSWGKFIADGAYSKMISHINSWSFSTQPKPLDFTSELATLQQLQVEVSKNAQR